MQSTASMDLQSPWQHLQGANSNNPMPTQFQRRSDVLKSSVSSEYHTVQYLDLQAIYDGDSMDLHDGIHEVSLSDHINGSVSNRHPSRSCSQKKSFRLWIIKWGHQLEEGAAGEPQSVDWELLKLKVITRIIHHQMSPVPCVLTRSGMIIRQALWIGIGIHTK